MIAESLETTDIRDSLILVTQCFETPLGTVSPSFTSYHGEPGKHYAHRHHQIRQHSLLIRHDIHSTNSSTLEDVNFVLVAHHCFEPLLDTD